MRTLKRKRIRIAVALLVVSGLVAAAAANAAPFGFILTWGTPGTASGSLRGPDNVAVDMRGNVYVADRLNNRIQKFSSQGQFLTRWGRNGGDGTRGLGNGEFRAPRGVTTDLNGGVWVADSGNNRIQRIDSKGRFLARFGRNGGDGTRGLGNGEFSDPRGLATDVHGSLYVADHGNNRIQKLFRNGDFLARWGRNGGDGTRGLGNGEFNNPRGVAVDRRGNIYVADKNNNRIQELDPAGRFLLKWGRNGGDGTQGTGNGEFRTPYSVSVDRSGIVYVADTFNNRVQAFTRAGAFLFRFGRNGGDGSAGAGPGEFRAPYGVAADCRGNVYVSDEDNNRIQKFGDAGAAPPVCPPALALGRLPQRLPGRTVALSVSSDQPAQVRIGGFVSMRGRVVARFALVRRSLDADAQATIKLRLGRSAAKQLRRSLAAGVRAVVTVEARASGFAGSAGLLRKTGRLGS
jgi:DNA-binding beta-propeller fold protein YncE